MIKDKLQSRQLAVYQVDPWTGVKLNESNEWATSGDQHLFIVEDMESALRIVKDNLETNPISEWWIVNSLGETQGPFKNQEALMKECVSGKAKIKKRWFGLW